MTADNFTDAARAEAERRYNRIVRRNKTADEWLDEGRASGFTSGAEWARTHLAAQEPTEAECEAAAVAICSGAGGCDPCFNWDDSVDGGCTYCTRHARAALSAARATRRDEEKQ